LPIIDVTLWHLPDNHHMMAQKLGDFEAKALFDEIYQAHGRAILGYALRRTSIDAAQDIAAETFLVAWRRIDEVPKEPLPWLLGVARRILANQRRSATRAELCGRG
jgi:DNA-directed RNA polymerase specialized sigma24 family protein